jgi:hypothetical protein
MNVHIEGEIIIHRPSERVFDFVADERNEPKYNPRMRRVEKITEGPIACGTQFSAEILDMGRPVKMLIEITGYERPRRLASSAHMETMDLHGTLRFEPVANGTRMIWSWELQPRGLLRLLGPLIAFMGRNQEKRIWNDLKLHLERSPE